MELFLNVKHHDDGYFKSSLRRTNQKGPIWSLMELYFAKCARLLEEPEVNALALGRNSGCLVVLGFEPT